MINQQISEIAHEISFENVTFGYSEDEPVIKDLSFKVKKGEKIAIVGETGAGKTTIVKLLMRFYDVNSGNADIPMNYLCKVGQVFGIDTAVLINGDETHAQTYFVTRKGGGISVERSKAYKYRDLAGGFRGAKATPFLVTVDPSDAPMHLNSHPGQEFNLVEKGRMLLSIDGKEITLEEGDSIYFDATKPHGMKALDGEKARFLAIIL